MPDDLFSYSRKLAHRITLMEKYTNPETVRVREQARKHLRQCLAKLVADLPSNYSRPNPSDFSKSERVIINLGTRKKPVFRSGVITAVRSGNIYLRLDSGEKVSSRFIPNNSTSGIVGFYKGQPRANEIPLSRLKGCIRTDKWFAKGLTKLPGLTRLGY